MCLCLRRWKQDKMEKSQAVPVTVRRYPQSCETWILPYYLENRLADGGEVISLTRRLAFTALEDSWYSFLLDAESTLGPYFRSDNLASSNWIKVNNTFEGMWK
jgi:hypothetical protein